MTSEVDQLWFLSFQVELNDQSDADFVWTDAVGIPVIQRQPTRAEKLSILLIGATAIGFIVLLVATLLVAVYFTRR